LKEYGFEQSQIARIAFNLFLVDSSIQDGPNTNLPAKNRKKCSYSTILFFQTMLDWYFPITTRFVV